MPSYYAATVEQFLNAKREEIIETLARSDQASGFAQLSHLQVQSWRESIDLVRDAVGCFTNKTKIVGVALEYRIPRREKRIDCVLIGRSDVLVIEFKLGASSYTEAALNQGIDYGLDLCRYHAESHLARVHVIICATTFRDERRTVREHPHGLASVKICSQRGLAETIDSCLDGSAGSLTLERWLGSRYKPIPGILEAVNLLFATSDLGQIGECLASSDELERVLNYILGQIRDARRQGDNRLLLVSGVPGSGKTLIGLRLAHETQGTTGGRVVFTSGNGPLLKVIRESLARAYQSSRQKRLAEARRYAEALLHSVHSFIEEGARVDEPPFEQVVIFDEAQRAWGKSKMEKMKARQRKYNAEAGLPAPSNSIESEPYSLLSIMGRAKGSVVVALCGNGQEIHDGEAGIEEWLRSAAALGGWRVVASPIVKQGLASTINSEYATDQLLHLEVPLRSHHATGHTQWVDAVLSGHPEQARRLIAQQSLPILLSRSMEQTREFFECLEVGSRRYGILASSSSGRLRPYGIEVSADFRKAVDYPMWFTGPRDDYRSCYSLETAASEFEVQGLELDWTVVAWSWDLLLSPNGAKCQSLRGMAWQAVKDRVKRDFLVNKYRVLLTRAREGIVLFLPKGSCIDGTRDPSAMDLMEQYFYDCGAVPLKSVPRQPNRDQTSR